ncbi:hypothetical protein AAZX31_16G090000 [Glycine max]|uniref:Uncharacterized protein n=2 Tax=Glycine subgen. Soja TaxID=1462606 RepID=K7MGI9_SOYBN|nr:uncharacterized protein LOC121173670 [Glycine max]KAG4940907.1 hypothetical protein JHK87_044778 [Glycine soja]KAG4938842.1 hypothetical protein JHK86_044983 [Glycine max]KAG4951682.1 hypothetical protein JHK85_045549 [Glycine max]KAG5108127.1 hypothetical protein JHK84_045034 [Glycine max]KAH1150745.1 hypothetical protein GYH30_044652 [Glycine max]
MLCSCSWLLWVYKFTIGTLLLTFDKNQLNVSAVYQGRERLVEWKKDPLFPNATLYWNTIIYGIYHLPHFLQNAGHFKIDALLKIPIEDAQTHSSDEPRWRS